MVLLRVFASALCLAAITVAGRAGAQTVDPQRTAQQAQAKQQLAQVREQIHQLALTTKDTNTQRNAAVAGLREQELKISATAKELRVLDERLAAQRTQLEKLLTQRTSLDTQLQDQRDALAALLRSAYAIGRDEQLKLLLAQDRIDHVGRMLAYYRYFERARLHEIDDLLHSLDALAQVQGEIEAATVAIKAAQQERTAQAQQLDGEREERKDRLATLEASLKDQHSRLAALGRNEQALVDLLAKLRDIFADIPAHPTGAEPFAGMRGKLPWPLHGRVVLAFGVSANRARAAQGLLIAAASGSEVHAVSHGRVVFADWLRGYGLLLIVDHGDGYMSLYGDNETLLKDVGDWVDAGQVVATSGDSGGKATPGLYFELRYKGKAVDPSAWLESSR